jgi:hypothetical protein
MMVYIIDDDFGYVSDQLPIMLEIAFVLSLSEFSAAVLVRVGSASRDPYSRIIRRTQTSDSQAQTPHILHRHVVVPEPIA